MWRASAHVDKRRASVPHAGVRRVLITSGHAHCSFPRGHADAPLLLAARGSPSSSSRPSNDRGETERREAQHLGFPLALRSESGAHLRANRDARAWRRSIYDDFSRRGHASGTGQGLVFPLVPQAFARVHPAHVQPRRAAPHSRDGRLPDASRTRGCEPRAQAPRHDPNRISGPDPGRPVGASKPCGPCASSVPPAAPSSRRLMRTPLERAGQEWDYNHLGIKSSGATRPSIAARGDGCPTQVRA
jgi:hypothetical protein